MAQLPDLTLNSATAWRASILFVSFIALFNALIGIADLPPDHHEAYVHRTATEMLDCGDWIVPFFNNQPRTTKPPLSYWLTALVGKLRGNNTHISVTPTRLVSAASGIGIVWLSLYIGVIIFDRRAAVVSGVILATSSGYFSYTHDGKPECSTRSFASYS